MRLSSRVLVVKQNYYLLEIKTQTFMGKQHDSWYLFKLLLREKKKTQGNSGLNSNC